MDKKFSLNYAAKIRKDGDGFLLTFRDIENAFTWASSYEEALLQGQEVLDLMLLDRLEKEENIPDPSMVKRGEIEISASPDVVAPILLHKVRIAKRKSMAEVARKMGVTYQRYQRVESGKNLTLKSFKKAAAAMGTTVEIILHTASGL